MKEQLMPGSNELGEAAIIKDDILPKVHQRELVRMIADPTFPWFFHKGIAVSDDHPEYHVEHADIVEDSYGFFHNTYWGGLLDNTANTDREGCTPAYQLIEPISYFLSEKFEFVYQKVIRCRMGFHVPRVGWTSANFHAPHVDQTGLDPSQTITVLYYVFDSDGDTFIFNENLRDGKPENVTVKERITPKANRAVLLDGGQYHASSCPTQTTQRVTINFNYLI